MGTTSYNEDSIKRRILKTGEGPHLADGRYATTQQGYTQEEAEFNASEQGATGQGARESLVDEDLHLKTNDDLQGHGEKPTPDEDAETPAEKPPVQRFYGGGFAPKEKRVTDRDL